jgi:hypothetical protein
MAHPAFFELREDIMTSSKRTPPAGSSLTARRRAAPPITSSIWPTHESCRI